MRDNIKMGLILAIFTSIAGLLLGIVHESTKEAIAANGTISKDSIVAIMPKANKATPTDEMFEKDSAIQGIMEAYSDDKSIGYILTVKTKGFHGEIEMLVGVLKDGKVSGISIVSHSETPGVGSKVEKNDFTDRFKDKSINEPLKATKTVSAKESEISAVSGATISSKAVVKGVNDALEYYKSNLSGKGGN